MRITISLTGTSPLLSHNEQLADPDNEIVREIRKITDKRKKTEDDRKEIAKLEWYGGWYLNNGVPVAPTRWLWKSFVNSGKITKQGTAVQRALNFTAIDVPIIHNGPKDIDAMFANQAYHDRRAVGISTKKTMRTRPKLAQWAVETEAEFLESVMDIDDFIAVAERAGLACGIGDARVLGFGRFSAKVAV